MSILDVTRAVPIVLAWYPAPLRDGSVVPLGNHGGFSGAGLWRIGDAVCLRASPPSADPSPVAAGHRLMILARRSGLSFVPTVFAALDGSTVIEHAGRLWELMEW